MYLKLTCGGQWGRRKNQQCLIGWWQKDDTGKVTETQKTGTKEVWSRSGLGQLEFEVSHEGEESTTSSEI